MSAVNLKGITNSFLISFTVGSFSVGFDFHSVDPYCTFPKQVARQVIHINELH